MAEPAAKLSAREFLPERHTLAAARRASADCRGCPLWRNATQTVFGEGLKRARMMLVGETPGDREDRAGKPFVGPAGRLLDEGLAAAAIDRKDTYVTNVVKHFKWEARGRRRLHRKPSTAEIGACLPWLELEIELVAPEVVVCLGATAAQALIGPAFRVSRDRGRLQQSDWAPQIIATVHPSSLLRTPKRESREPAMRQFIADLEVARDALARRSA
jgi:uracil-DNA glycosylase